MGQSGQTKMIMVLSLDIRKNFYISSLFVSRNNLLDCTYINRNETFIVFFLPGLPRLQKLLSDILIFMAR